MSNFRRTALMTAVAGRTASATLLLTFVVLMCVPAQTRAQAAPPWIAPERAARRSNPVALTTESTNRGLALFRRECEKCHGKSGHGDGPQGLSLSPRPKDLMSEPVQSQSDGALFWKMSEGRGLMPIAPFGDNDKWAVIDYIRMLAGKK